MARADDGQIIPRSGRWGKRSETSIRFGHIWQGAFGSQQPSIPADELVLGFAELLEPGLPIELVEQRFGIEGFQVAGTARH